MQPMPKMLQGMCNRRKEALEVHSGPSTQQHIQHLILVYSKLFDICFFCISLSLSVSHHQPFKLPKESAQPEIRTLPI